MQDIPELLAPAGNISALQAAFANGADACYLGLKDFNARAKSVNFTYSQLEAALEAAKRYNKKIYVTVNTVVCEDEVDRLYSLLDYLSGVGVDAVIVQDLGVMQLVRRYFRRLKLHVSTQAATASVAGVNYFKQLGAERIVLARELNLPEIATIARETSAELEVFCHGSLCIAYSGLCLFSSYHGGSSANRGACTQSCRRLYSDQNSQEKLNFFSAKDLEAVALVPKLAQMGINSLKIEGRMKSADYVAVVSSAYRYVLDHLDTAEEAVAYAQKVLKTDFGREKTQFFMADRQNTDFVATTQPLAAGLFLGAIEQHADDLVLTTTQKLTAGAFLRVQRRDDSMRTNVRLKEDLAMLAGGSYVVTHLAINLEAGDLVYLSGLGQQKGAALLPNNLNHYQQKPRHLHAPKLKNGAFGPHQLKAGAYVLLATIEQLKHFRPLATEVWLEGTTKNLVALSGAAFSTEDKSHFAIYLAPFSAEEERLSFEKQLLVLIEQGYTRFVVNSSATLYFLAKYPEVELIAGPYLYVHNRFAAEFLLYKPQVKAVILPLETSLANITHLVQSVSAENLMITVFAYPELFQMRHNVQAMFNLTQFSDEHQHNFTTVANSDGSKVLPEKPFSILAQQKKLTNLALTKFVYDLRYLSAQDMKQFRQILAGKQQIFQKASKVFNFEQGFLKRELDKKKQV